MTEVIERRTKVVLRKLPQFLTEDELREMISPIPPYNYFRFCAFDPFFDGCELCRAYVNFKDSEDAKQFIERFNDYVFVDSKGNESNAEVVYALNQEYPRSLKARRDPTVNTLENDRLYKMFLESQEEKSITRDEGETEKPPWEVILEDILKLEANPIPETETNLLRSLTNKLERRKTKSAAKRSNKTNKGTKKVRQKNPRSRSPKIDATESSTPLLEVSSSASASRPPKNAREKPLPRRRAPRPTRHPEETLHNERSESESSTGRQPPPPPSHLSDPPRNRRGGRGRGRAKHPPSYSVLHARSTSSTIGSEGDGDRKPRSDGASPYCSYRGEDDFDAPPRRPRGGYVGSDSEGPRSRGGPRRGVGSGDGGGYRGGPPRGGRSAFSRNGGRGRGSSNRGESNPQH